MADQNAQLWPVPKFHFRVEWNGDVIGCQEVSGLKFTTEMIEYRVGDDETFIKKRIPGLKKFDNITLKKGVFETDDRFYNWWKEVQNNKEHKVTLTIHLLDEEHKEVMTWTVERAFVLSMTSPDLNAQSNELAIESIEIAHEGIVLS